MSVDPDNGRFKVPTSQLFFFCRMPATQPIKHQRCIQRGSLKRADFSTAFGDLDFDAVPPPNLLWKNNQGMEKVPPRVKDGVPLPGWSF